MRRKPFAVVVVLAVLAMAGAAFAAIPGGTTRDLYLVSTDGYAFVPMNGAIMPGAKAAPAPASVQCGIRGAPGSPEAKSFDGLQALLPLPTPGWCKYWIRGFAGANGPDRDPAGESITGVAGGAWKPPITLRGKASFPAPIIDVNEGDDVFIHLANIGNIEALAPSDPHTIHLHGQATTTQNDGFPETSWVVPVGAQAVYYFYAERPGSYMYHCHVEASEHVQMGMYGALIIRPSDFNVNFPTVFTNAINNNNTGQFNDRYDSATAIVGFTGTAPTAVPITATRPMEYVFLLGDVDMTWHEQVRTAKNPPDAAAQFKPVYWLLNGRSFPDTIGIPVVTKFSSTLVKTGTAATGGTAGLPVVNGGSGPPDGFLPGSNNLVNYGTVYEIPNFGTPAAPTGDNTIPSQLVFNNPSKILIRYIDISYNHSPMHFHGWHIRVVGIDGNPVPTSAQKDEFTLIGGSGKTYDVIMAALPRDNTTLPYSAYGNNSPRLATGQANTSPAPEFNLLPAGYPIIYQINGLQVPGPIAALNTNPATTLGAGFADIGATQFGGAALGVGGLVTVSGPTMLPAGACIQLAFVDILATNVRPDLANALPFPGYINTLCPLPTKALPGPFTVSPAVQGIINPFPVRNNILDQWYPTHDHNDYKVTNNGLYPGGAIALFWAHQGAPAIPRP